MGSSLAPYDGLNLAEHVGDNPAAVENNRALLHQALNLPSTPLWLQQVHGNTVINSRDWFSGVKADACWTDQHETICAILSADCLPLLLCDEDGSQVAPHSQCSETINAPKTLS